MMTKFYKALVWMMIGNMIFAAIVVPLPYVLLLIGGMAIVTAGIWKEGRGE